MGWGGYGEGGGGGGEGVWGVIVRGMDDMMHWQGACVRCVLCLSINGSGFERDITISGAPSSFAKRRVWSMAAYPQYRMTSDAHEQLNTLLLTHWKGEF